MRVKRLVSLAVAFSLLCALAPYALAADDLFVDIKPPAPTPGSAGSATTTPTTTPTPVTPTPAPYPTAQTPPTPATPKPANTTNTPGSSSGNSGSGSTPTQTQTAPTQTATNTNTPPLANTAPVQNEPETTTPTVEEPAVTATNSPLLYSLLGIIAVLTILVGALVVGVMRKHEIPATTAALLREEAPYMQRDNTLRALSPQVEIEAPHGPPRPTPGNTQSFVHHPSVDEARTFIQMLRDKGYTDSQIRDHFNSHGWNDEQVAVAMRRN